MRLWWPLDNLRGVMNVDLSKYTDLDQFGPAYGVMLRHDPTPLNQWIGSSKNAWSGSAKSASHLYAGAVTPIVSRK
jgi:hypothetical protein